MMRNRLLLLAALLALDLGGAPVVALAQGRNAQGSPPVVKPTTEIPAEVQGWADAAVEAYQKGKPAEALRLQLQVMEWVKGRPEPAQGFRALALLRLGALLSAVGRRQEALAPTEEAVRIRRELAKTNPAYLGDLAGALNNLGNCYSELGRRQEALAPTEEAVRVYRDLAKTNPAYLGDLAGALGNLGMHYSNLGRRQEALAPTEEAVRIRHELAKTNLAYLGDLAMALNNLGNRYSELGRRQEALVPTEEAVRVYRDLAKTNPAYLVNLASALNNLGVRYSELGRRQEALAPTEEAVQLYRELAKINPAYLGDLAAVLNNLGTRYSELGRRQEALAPTEEAVQLYRELAKINPTYLGDLAMALNNLGKAISELGRRQEALAPTEEAVRVYRDLAKTNPAYLGDLASALNNLGVRYSELGRRQEALAPTEEAVRVYRELAKTNPGYLGDLPRALNNLGKFLSELGRHQEALAPTEEAVRVYRDLAKTNPTYLGDLALALNNLGASYSEFGRRQEALAPIEEAVRIYRELAKSNPAFQEDLARSATNQAILELALSKTTSALPLLQESVSSEMSYLRSQLPLLPEGRRQALVEVFGDRWQLPFSVAQQGPAGAELALFTRLNRQGLLLDIQRNQALLARSGPQRPLLEQLQAVTAQLAGTSLTVAESKRLLEQKERLEQQLYRLLPQIRPQLVQSAQIARRLPAAGALIEFQRYRSYDARKPAGQEWGSQRYLALLLKPDGSIRAIDLGEAAPLDALVAQTLEFSERKRLNVDEPLQALSDKLLGPLRQELAGTRELFVSPDGELNRLPFAALPMPGQSERLLSEAIKLRLLTSGRDLVRLQQAGRSGGPSALVANPDFGPRAAAPSGTGGSRSGQGGHWSPLPYTAEEASRLAPLLQVPQPLTGSQASAANVLTARRPRILHIASHGFFWSEEQGKEEANQKARICRGLADSRTAAASAGSGPSPMTPAGSTTRTDIRASTQTGPRPPEQADSPGSAGAAPPSQTLEALQRSGIVLAGANQPCRTPEEDGYLTAAEVTGMDLEGTELTTLSACQTGLGDVRSGEGVYGLQRALAVAGSRSTLLTLWKVGDQGTQEFMAEFYKRLRRGEGRAEALAATQAAFRNHQKEEYRHVYWWGAFQLSGDWRPLPGP